jgi:hypothetical protein
MYTGQDIKNNNHKRLDSAGEPAHEWWGRARATCQRRKSITDLLPSNEIDDDRNFRRMQAILLLSCLYTTFVYCVTNGKLYQPRSCLGPGSCAPCVWRACHAIAPTLSRSSFFGCKRLLHHINSSFVCLANSVSLTLLCHHDQQAVRPLSSMVTYRHSGRAYAVRLQTNGTKKTNQTRRITLKRTLECSCHHYMLLWFIQMTSSRG